MTTLFDDPNYGMYENQGGILQNPGQNAPGIALAPAQPVLPQSRMASTQDARRGAIDQMGTGQKILTALGEFGAGVQGRPSPLNARIQQQKEDQLLKIKTQQEKVQTMEAYSTIAKSLTGDAKKNFVNSAKTDLEAIYPGMGDTFGHIADNPSLLETFDSYKQFLPATYQAILKNNPDQFMKLIGTKDGLKVLQDAADKPALDLALKKASILAMGYQHLPVPPELIEQAKGGMTLSLLHKINDALPDGYPAKMNEDQLRVARQDPETFAGAIGVAGPKEEQSIIGSKMKDKGKRELTEIGVGKDAKGNDLFQKAYIENGKVIERVGESYQKKDGVSVTVGGMVPVIDNDKKSPTYGKQVFAQASKSGGPASIVPNVIPVKAGSEPLSKEATDNLAIQSMYDKSVFGRISQEDRRQVENRIPELMKEYGITSQDVVAGRAGYKADAASLSALTKQYDAVSAFQNTAIRNGDQLIALADKVDKTGVPVIEKWIRQGRSALGDADVAKFQAQLQIYRTEAAKILTNPNLTGQLTDAARGEVEEFLKGGSSADQIRGVVNLLKNDFGNRITTIKEQMDAAHNRINGQIPAGEAVVRPDSNPGAPGDGKPLPASGDRGGFNHPGGQDQKVTDMKPASSGEHIGKESVGKIFKDASGNRAKYLGNGQWQQIH